MYLSHAVRQGNQGVLFFIFALEGGPLMLLRPSRLAVAVARADHHDVLVLRNELNEHIRPGMLVWGVFKFSTEKKMKEQPSFYAFFIYSSSGRWSRRRATPRRSSWKASGCTPSSTCGDSTRRT